MNLFTFDFFWKWWILACVIIFVIPFIIRKIKIKKNKDSIIQSIEFQELKDRANKIDVKDEQIKRTLNFVLKHIDDIEKNNISAQKINLNNLLKMLDIMTELDVPQASNTFENNTNSSKEKET